MGCKKCAEEVCGCSTMNAEEPVVQEPDFIPNGDGRVIGQQDFAINLTPLHAEDDEGRHICDECGKVADYNVQDVEYRWNLDEGEFTGKGDVRHHIGDINEFYCEDCYYKSGYRAETFEASVLPSKEEYMKSLTKRDKEGHPTRLVVAIDTSGSTSIDYKGRMGETKYPLLKKYETMARQMAKTMNTDEFIILDWNGHGVTHGPRQGGDSLESYNGTGSIEMIGKWLQENGVMTGEYIDTVVIITDGVVREFSFKYAETTGSPSPTFNEGITGQDGPSENPTNQVFNAMRTLAPSTRDVDSARTMLRNSGYGEVIYDRYIVNQQGSSNKFYYTAITEKDGKYYPMGAYGRIGYLGRLFNVAGKTERPMAHFGSMEEAYRQIRGKEVSKINARKPEKRYVDYTLRRGAESLSEIEGPTAEATTGGLHSPSSFDMTWEDGTGQSSASIPPNEIAWADTKGIPLWIKVGIGAAVVFAGKKLVSSRSSAQKAENNLKSPVKSRKSCCGGKRADTVRKDSEFSVGQINPVEVEGQSDVYGAEELHSPQTSAKVSQPNWGPQTTYLQNQRSTQKMW